MLLAPRLASAEGNIALLQLPKANVVECYLTDHVPRSGDTLARLSHSAQRFPFHASSPLKMKFLQQLVSKKNAKQNSSKQVTPSPIERKPLEAAVVMLETEPPRISLENVADNLPRLDDNTLLCILQAFTSPVALTKARMVSLLVTPHRHPHHLTASSSDLQAAIRLWRRKDPMGALGTRTVPTGAVSELTQARSPARRQRGTVTAGRPEVASIA